MCTSIIEIARAEGMAKRGDEWFPLSQAVVAYDHARHAPLGDVITLDFINTALEPWARAISLGRSKSAASIVAKWLGSDVACWHLSDLPPRARHVRCQGTNGLSLDAAQVLVRPRADILGFLKL
jgi:hypothetical protein